MSNRKAQLKEGDEVIITAESSKCGVLRNVIGKTGTIGYFLFGGGTEIAEVHVDGRTWYIQTKYLKKK